MKNDFKIIRTGATRTVILVGKYALKLPFTFHTNTKWRGFWYRLLNGLLANIQEREFCEVKYEPIPFAPVLFFISGGFLVVMPRGTPISDEEWENVKNVIEENLLPPVVEGKRDSFAKISGRIYAVDYGS